MQLRRGQIVTSIAVFSDLEMIVAFEAWTGFQSSHTGSTFLLTHAPVSMDVKQRTTHDAHRMHQRACDLCMFVDSSLVDLRVLSAQRS